MKFGNQTSHSPKSPFKGGLLKDRIMRVTFTPCIPLNPPSKADFEDRIMRETFAKDLGFMTLDVPDAAGFGIRFCIFIER